MKIFCTLFLCLAVATPAAAIADATTSQPDYRSYLSDHEKRSLLLEVAQTCGYLHMRYAKLGALAQDYLDQAENRSGASATAYAAVATAKIEKQRLTADLLAANGCDAPTNLSDGE